MTGKFERGILILAGGLVIGLLTLAVMYPPSSEITLPDAQLKAPTHSKTEDKDAGAENSRTSSKRVEDNKWHACPSSCTWR